MKFTLFVVFALCVARSQQAPAIENADKPPSTDPKRNTLENNVSPTNKIEFPSGMDADSFMAVFRTHPTSQVGEQFKMGKTLGYLSRPHLPYEGLNSAQFYSLPTVNYQHQPVIPSSYPYVYNYPFYRSDKQEMPLYNSQPIYTGMSDLQGRSAEQLSESLPLHSFQSMDKMNYEMYPNSLQENMYYPASSNVMSTLKNGEMPALNSQSFDKSPYMYQNPMEDIHDRVTYIPIPSNQGGRAAYDDTLHQAISKILHQEMNSMMQKIQNDGGSWTVNRGRSAEKSQTEIEKAFAIVAEYLQKGMKEGEKKINEAKVNVGEKQGKNMENPKTDEKVNETGEKKP